MKHKKILEIKNISKSFPGVKALDQVNLNIYKSKVMGLVGENGAGKSTIINIIGSIHEPDQGQILYKDKIVAFSKIKDAKKSGISIVHQEIQLADNLSIVENIFLGNPIKNSLGIFQWSKMKDVCIRALQKLQVNYDPLEKVENLSIASKQLVEIARALVFKSSIIIFDEPTSSLSSEESENLFKVINDLKQNNVSCLYVSHRMEEIKKVCDDVTIFRDGKSIIEKPVSKITESEIVEYMIGRKLIDQYSRKTIKRGNKIFEAKNIKNQHVQNINFALYEREVLGFFGLVGSGRTELFKSIIGLYEKSGEIFLMNQKINFPKPADAIKKGIYYLSEDRKSEGLIVPFSVKFNTSLSSLRTLYIKSYVPIISHKNEKYMTKRINARLKTKMNSLNDACVNLSGGNQQKVALAKILMTIPKIIILDEPTRGIDVGAKKEIYDLIQELKTSGNSIIVISSDIQEIIGISDRIAIMSDGKLIAKKDALKTSSSEIMSEIVKSKKASTVVIRKDF